MGKVDGFLGVSWFVIGGLITIHGLTNSNQMVQRGEIQPVLGILTMMLALEKLD